MKAIILCGGFAKRMGSMAEDMPKTLLHVKGKPVLEHLLKKIEPLEQIDQIFVSTNTKFEKQLTNFFQHYQSPKFIKLVVEPTRNEEEKLGAVKGLEYVVDQEKIEEPVLLVSGDNLLDSGLFGILMLYKQKKSPVVGLYDVGSKELARKYGIVELDDNNRIASFEEKPEEPKSTLASTGIYIFTFPALQKLTPYLKDNSGDRPGDFIKWLSQKEKVYGFVFEGKWFDIGSPKEYQRAEEELE